MKPLPTLFVSHGAPTLALDAVPAHDFLVRLGRELERPRAIVCASAHWTTDEPSIESGKRPRTIHDFSGFDPKLYSLRYPARGEPDVARRVQGLLAANGIESSLVERGIDHGAWVPLVLMVPEADIPVIQLSLQPELGARHHLELGRALLGLREEGVLVLGSGSATHNLGELQPGVVEPPDWVAAFDDWLVARAEAGAEDALVDYLCRAPNAGRNHPTAEHFLPLLVALGAAGEGARARTLHRSTTFGVLSMTAFVFA